MPTEEQLRMHDPRVIDSGGRLLDVSEMSEADLAGTIDVMNAIARWRLAEQRVSEASRRYMNLSETEMRAVRYILVQTNGGRIVTARDVAQYLRISSASTTKLLDRLEAGEHVRRRAHPSDRRAIALSVTEQTRIAAEATIGAEHARRFTVAAALSPAERGVVRDFLEALSQTGEQDWPAREAG